MRELERGTKLHFELWIREDRNFKWVSYCKYFHTDSTQGKWKRQNTCMPPNGSWYAGVGFPSFLNAQKICHPRKNEFVPSICKHFENPIFRHQLVDNADEKPLCCTQIFVKHFHHVKIQMKHFHVHVNVLTVGVLHRKIIWNKLFLQDVN